ncbi:MAG: hypothetical protein HY716_08810 [Planctomycetes bacterium]|nr:hypothetical protein [Planctomycetota bacterium]
MIWTLREWAVVAAFAAAVVLWPRDGASEVDRIPYDLSEDYWLFDLHARREGPVVLGDSFVWGAYVRKDETLPFRLGARNLGVHGGHPAALAGLIEHYGAGIRRRKVILHCNPLWLSSPRLDLSRPEEFTFNHPELVPQFSPHIACYKADLSRRLAIIVRRSLPFFAWTKHLQQVRFDRRDIPSWTVEHPYELPGLQPLAPPDETSREKPLPWTERGLRPCDYEWVDPDRSFQWASFLRAIRLLRERGNDVVVLVGPFNEHALTVESRSRYRALRARIEAGLRAAGVRYVAPEPLPSRLYADASHPLAEGYEMLARSLGQTLSGEAATKEEAAPKSSP